MPATIGDILKTKPELVTTTPDAPLYEAIEQMLRYEYSQLPVLDNAGCPIGMLNSDAIVRALHHFGSSARAPKTDAQKAQHLRVRDAMYRQIETCSPEHEVFEVHRQLHNVSGVLVVDDHDKLVGIITGYDTTEYLRQRVQDIVFVQDIEERIKDYVRLAFRKPDGSDNDDALNTAIGEISRSSNEQGKLSRQILDAYLQNKDGNDGKIDEAVFAKTLQQQILLKKTLTFDDLVLSQHIQLFLKYGLQSYGQVFQLDRKIIALMLDSVRETRNDLAHLRIDISARQRDELRFCREWLKDYYEAARALMLPAAQTQPAPSATPTPYQNGSGATNNIHQTAPIVVAGVDEVTVAATVDEVTVPSEGRYAPLANWLFGLAADQDRILLSFGQIEQIIGGKLPQSAREYRSWWANDSARSRHSDTWLSAGWRTYDVDVDRGRVNFTRLLARERAYSEFFAALLDDLRPRMTSTLFAPTKVGYHWQSIARFPEQPPYVGYTTFSFTRARYPRADLYIDVGNQSRNKAIFDALLARREEIEAMFGQPLKWERMSEQRAARIASYYDTEVTINAAPEVLSALRAWGVEVLTHLHAALIGQVTAVLAELTPNNG